jgi:hypothetical protein
LANIYRARGGLRSHDKNIYNDNRHATRRADDQNSDALLLAKLRRMNITLHIPGDLARLIGTAGDIERRTREGLALAEYQAGRLTRPELAPPARV